MPIPFSPRSLLVPALLLAAIPSPAQARQQADASRAEVELALRQVVMPLHREADGLVWGGAWTYKASFGRHMTMFMPPADPQATRAVQVSWTHTRVRPGARPTGDLDAGADPVFADRTCRLRRSMVTEVYELRPAGLAQSFELERRPGDGDLVVTGRLAGSMYAPRREPVHGPILFCDAAGRPVLEYGAAVVLDATGRRAPIATGWNGAEVELVVPDAWLDDATFPVVIDPLLAPRGLSSMIGVGQLSMVELTGTNFMPFLVAGTRYFFNDWDIFVIRYDRDFGGGYYVYTEVSATSDGSATDVVYVAGARRWLLSGYRRSRSSSTQQFLYAHDRDDLGLNSGDEREVSIAAFGGAAALGGVRGAGTQAMLVTRLPTSSGNFLRAVPVDVRGRPSLLPSQLIDVQPDIGHVAINRVAGSVADGWLVAYWISRTSIGLVRVGGTVSGRSSFTVSGVSRYYGAPLVRVGGEANRYLVAYTDQSARPAGDARVLVRRVDTGAAWRILQAKAIAGPAYVTRITEVAYDTDTRSHWCIAHQENKLDPRTSGIDEPMQITRVGFKGGVVDKYRYWFDGAFARTSVVYDRSRDRFAIATGTYPQPLGRFLEHSTQARNYVYGTSCSGGRIGAAPPYAGSEFWRIWMHDPDSRNGLALLRFSPRAADVALGAGFGPCRSFLDFGAAGSMQTLMALNGAGYAVAELELVDDPLWLGFQFYQWIYTDPSVGWGTKVGSTAGLAANVQH